MKLVAISDTHGYHHKLEIPEGDVLICTGDFTNIGEKEETCDFLEWFELQSHQYKLLVAGNHDFSFERSPDKVKQWLKELAPSVTYLQDSGITISINEQTLRFWGSPWQPWFHNWAFNIKAPARLKDKWDLIPTDTDVLLTHSPPQSILDRNLEGEECGCSELYKRVMEIKPKLHIFGHIHEGYGLRELKDTIFINASTCTRNYLPTNQVVSIEI